MIPSVRRRPRLLALVAVGLAVGALTGCSTGGDRSLVAAAQGRRAEVTLDHLPPTTTTTTTEVGSTVGGRSSGTGSGGAGGAGAGAGGSGGTTAPSEPAEPDYSSVAHDDSLRTARPQQCLEAAKAPWAEVLYDVDPLARVRARSVPAAPGAPWGEVVDLPTPEDAFALSRTRLDDPGGLADTWRSLGYQEGVMVRYLHNGWDAHVTAVRFRDGAAAREALTAHLADYCRHSADAQRWEAGNGITVLRDHGATASLWVQGDVELTAVLCLCFADGDRERLDLAYGWGREVVESFGPESTDSPTF